MTKGLFAEWQAPDQVIPGTTGPGVLNISSPATLRKKVKGRLKII
jgi:hypothetical protein